MTKKDDPFKRFQARTRPKRLRPDEVSLTKANLVISEELADAHLAGVTHVLLLFNPQQRIIGIRPVEPGEKGYKMSYRSVSSRSFCQHFGIHERGRFRTRFHLGMLRVHLREQTT